MPGCLGGMSRHLRHADTVACRRDGGTGRRGIGRRRPRARAPDSSRRRSARRPGADGSRPAAELTARTDRDYLSSSFSDLPALNFADFDAGISMLSPVLGLRPVRALRSETANVPTTEMLGLSRLGGAGAADWPTPEMLILSPLHSALTMSSKTRFTARSACPLGRSSFAATDSIR